MTSPLVSCVHVALKKSSCYGQGHEGQDGKSKLPGGEKSNQYRADDAGNGSRQVDQGITCCLKGLNDVRLLESHPWMFESSECKLCFIVVCFVDLCDYHVII